MKEIELKILEIDKKYIIEKLISIGAIKKFEGNIQAFFYKNKDNKKIRLRKFNDGFNINYKEKVENSNFLENFEYETNFENFEIMEKILIGIGFNKYGTSTKYRISYFYYGITFDIDSYLGIPDFIEIEAGNIELVEKGVKLLGYNMNNTKLLTERELKELYGVG